MVRYDKIFSIIDIKEENMKKWGKCFHFIRMYKKRGLFFGRQLKRTCTILQVLFSINKELVLSPLGKVPN